MISKLHFAASLVLSYVLFYYLLYFDKISSVLVSLIIAGFSSIPDFDWKIYSWSNKQLILMNKNRLLKYILFPYYVFVLLTHRIFRHRTTTHSAFFVIILVILGYLLSPIFYLIALATLLHIIEDLFTISGVPLFYPLSKKMYKIPIINTRKHVREQTVLVYLLYLLFIIMLLS